MIKVAILGGGCGAMAAAFELTKEENRGLFEVTLYQQGWRLGGKCASGRNETQSVIQEHGLHMLIGFYEDAFRLLRQCYQEYSGLRGAAGPFRSFRDALIPQHRITFQERLGGARSSAWRSWNVDVPPRSGFPGDEDPPPTLQDIVGFFAKWLLETRRRVKAEAQRVLVLRHVFHWLAQSESLFARSWKKVAPSERAHRLALRIAAHGTRPRRAGEKWTPPVTLLRALAVLLEDALKEIELLTKVVENATGLAEVELKRDLLLLRLGYAAFKGLVSDVLLHDEDFSRIDHLEFREWLMKHGARQEDVLSAPIKALYDLGFAYVDGEASDPTKAQAAAGVALYVSLQLAFGCRGALLWKMKAAAGDILFAPLYEVLAARGVRFKFFHRVDELKLSADGTMVDTIRLTRQARMTQGGDYYYPLIHVPYGSGDGLLACWPSEPNWDQLDVSGEVRTLPAEQSFESVSSTVRAGQVTLRRCRAGRYEGNVDDEFDQVILGIPVGALPSICGELIDRRRTWRNMVAGIRTVQTQSLQLWMTQPLEGLGWSSGPTVSIAYVEPYDAWGEMSHLLAAERWGSSELPARSIHYFCSALPEFKPGLTRDEEFAVACANKDQFLSTAIQHLWPEAVDASGALDRTHVAHEYLRINVDPSERYVLSVPNSIALRRAPDCSTFANLYLAGDWVAGRVNSGSVEAAMSGGIRAADALRAATYPRGAAGSSEEQDPSPSGERGVATIERSLAGGARP